MASKGFLVKVELDVQKVTCPGVWLCSNGKVSLEMKMLDCSIQTKTGKPTFPILIYEKYLFSKTFHEDRRLNELQKSLNNEWFHTELIHWKSRDEGCVLATFQTTLDDLLYPTSFRGAVAGKETDLLMVPTSLFPGTIVPKLEIRTKTTIEEIITSTGSLDTAALPLTRNTMESLYRRCRTSPTRRVCHSVTYSRAQKPNSTKEKFKRPLFAYRKVPEDLILRKTNNWCFVDGSNSNNKDKRQTRGQCYCKSKGQNRPARRSPNIINEHTDKCSICSAYDGYFLPACTKAKYFISNCNLEKLCSFCRPNCDNDKCTCSPVSDTSIDHSYECVPYEDKSPLTQKLHDRLKRVLHSKCIDCRDVW